MNIKLDEIVEQMIKSLKEKAEQHDVNIEDIRKLFEDHKVNGLDDIFDDGGVVRCEYFTDFALDYSLQFGEIDTDPFWKAQWEAIRKAMDEF